jgi:hypothetical protein
MYIINNMIKMNFKLKNEVIRLPNADKDGGWIEHWSEETHRRFRCSSSSVQSMSNWKTRETVEKQQ